MCKLLEIEDIHSGWIPTILFTRPPIGPQSIGLGVTTPLAKFTPGMQETETTSTPAEKTTLGTKNPSIGNPQRTIGDDTKLQNLQAKLGQLKEHTNTLHHD
uniref:Uncharacterized protein n=1 Tax=Cannabis sativa TaxID=3483 RepID=A0A803P9F9_CANSA